MNDKLPPQTPLEFARTQACEDAPPPRIVIYGASGHALACRRNATHPNLKRPLCEVVAFVDDFDGGRGEMLDGLPVLNFEQWRDEMPELPCIIAVGAPESRRRLAEKVKAAGGGFARIHDQDPRRFTMVTVGDGTIIATGTCEIGVSNRIGAHVHIYPLAYVAHDVVIEDFVTVAAGANISGHVVIREGAFIGAGGVIAHGSAAKPLEIGARAVVGAGAVVMKSVPPGETVAGNPARSLRELARDRLATRRQAKVETEL